MNKVIILFLLLFLFASCTSKEEKAFLTKYDKQKYYHKNLIKSEKLQLYEEGMTKVMFTATYINKEKMESRQKRDERFILGIHIEENNESLEYPEAYTVSLNSKRARSFKALSSESELLKNVPFKNEWSHFYLVKFPHTTAKKLILKIENRLYGAGNMQFSKVAKYTYNREIFK